MASHFGDEHPFTTFDVQGHRVQLCCNQWIPLLFFSRLFLGEGLRFPEQAPPSLFVFSPVEIHGACETWRTSMSHWGNKTQDLEHGVGFPCPFGTNQTRLPKFPNLRSRGDRNGQNLILGLETEGVRGFRRTEFSRGFKGSFAPAFRNPT